MMMMIVSECYVSRFAYSQSVSHGKGEKETLYQHIALALFCLCYLSLSHLPIFKFVLLGIPRFLCRPVFKRLLRITIICLLLFLCQL